MSHIYQSLSHSRWDCNYHLVFVPKNRRKVLFGKIRKNLGEIFHELARYKGCKILEGHVMPDHVHMCISIPPKYAVSSIVGYLKDKNAIIIARQFIGRTRNFTGEHFWVRGYSVSTVGCEINKVRKYIKEQEVAKQDNILLIIARQAI